MADERYYRVILSYDSEHERFTARLPELEVEGKGDSRADALTALEAAIEARVERAAVDGETLPTPLDEPPPALELSLTLAPAVARELQFQAGRAGLSVEALASQLVARGVGPGPAPRRSASPSDVSDRPDRSGQSGRSGRPDGPGRSDASGEAAGAPGPGNRADDRGSQAPRRHQKNRRRRQEGYRPDMDDQANFLAYVRGMEKGGGGGRGGRGGGG